MNDCPFCKRIETEEVITGTALSAVFYDRYPISPGHCLIVPRRHIEDFFTLREEEQADLFRLVPTIKEFLDEHWRPQGYNLGMNVGEAAGQTVPHVHLHLIPRFKGDVPDPRGGIRWLIPRLAIYWEREKP